MLEALRAPDDANTHQRIRAEVGELCAEFAVPAAELEPAASN